MTKMLNRNLPKTELAAAEAKAPEPVEDGAAAAAVEKTPEEPTEAVAEEKKADE